MELSSFEKSQMQRAAILLRERAEGIAPEKIPQFVNEQLPSVMAELERRDLELWVMLNDKNSKASRSFHRNLGAIVHARINAN